MLQMLTRRTPITRYDLTISTTYADGLYLSTTPDHLQQPVIKLKVIIASERGFPSFRSQSAEIAQTSDSHSFYVVLTDSGSSSEARMQQPSHRNRLSSNRATARLQVRNALSCQRGPSHMKFMEVESALIFALCINLTFTRSINSKRDVCDVVNNQAADDACSMKKAFAGSSVYPQLVSEFSPLGALYVHFSEVIVGGAQQLTPSRVATKPNLLMALMRGPLSTHGAQMLSKKFVVMLVDFQPLARSAKPIWIQSGMTVNPSTSVMSSSIAPIVPYTAPNPQKGTGTHEYVFLVFEDRAPGLLASLPLHPQLTASLSGSFNLKTFRAQTGLQNLVAGSFFKSTHP
ncbi:hypothetical protein H4Q26_002448 [Puccinia striiformis f. sp. tritici PST-130]|nr:hypothetical protein H4Q26_002448 [Puccinia striiformis f. sp. tritici PST-130]